MPGKPVSTRNRNKWMLPLSSHFQCHGSQIPSILNCHILNNHFFLVETGFPGASVWVVCFFYYRFFCFFDVSAFSRPDPEISSSPSLADRLTGPIGKTQWSRAVGGVVDVDLVLLANHPPGPPALSQLGGGRKRRTNTVRLPVAQRPSATEHRIYKEQPDLGASQVPGSRIHGLHCYTLTHVPWLRGWHGPLEDDCILYEQVVHIYFPCDVCCRECILFCSRSGSLGCISLNLLLITFYIERCISRDSRDWKIRCTLTFFSSLA